MSMERRDEVVETVVENTPLETIEERFVDQNGVAQRVVRAVGQPAPAFVSRAPAPRRPSVTRTVSRIWQRSSRPVAATTEYVTIESPGGQPTLGQFLRITWFFVGLLEGLLALRFGLALLGANPNNGFAALVYGLTWPFVEPFRTLLGAPAFGGSVLETYTLVAMVVILFAWWIFVRFIGVLLNRPVDGSTE